LKAICGSILISTVPSFILKGIESFMFTMNSAFGIMFHPQRN